MLILSWQTIRMADIPYPQPLDCPSCRQPRRFTIDMTYSWCAIMLVCGVVYQQRLAVGCATCGRELKPPPPDAGRRASAHIPWWQRHGLAAMVTCVVLLAVATSLGGR